MPTALASFGIQLQNQATNEPIIKAGGTVYVAIAGDAAKATLYDPVTQLPLANPITPVRGRISFAVLASVAAVDLYGVDAEGRAFVRRGVRPGALSEIWLNEDPQQVLVIPFAKADVTANTEIDTGFDLPGDAAVHPMGLGVNVLTNEASRTIHVGLLSGETAGDADGFLAALSLATAGMANWAVSGTPTLGALLTQNFATTPAVNVPKQHTVIGSNAKSISYTLSASTASAKGFIFIPYIRPLAS